MSIRLRRDVRFRFYGNTGGAARDARVVESVNRKASDLVALPDGTLRQRAAALDPGEDAADWPSDARITEVCALVKEAARRVLGMPHYDVQLLAGIAMSRGHVAEMATGEGKTLTATLPAVAYGLRRQGVHVMTVNAYLAERDYQLMRPVYELLGLSVGLLKPGSQPGDKRAAYSCDITYGVGSEFGFDYLRDQVVLADKARLGLGARFRSLLQGRETPTAPRVQRGHACAIVDEADSVMIDEARTALVLSGSSGQPSSFPQVYERARDVAAVLEPDVHYACDPDHRVLTLLDSARDAIHGATAFAGIGLMRPWARYVEQALYAARVLRRDEDYIVADDRVQIIDEFTGRRFEDRTWSDGLHQAVEAEERVTITEESRSLLRVSRQRYLGMYEHLAGMTGTATGCEKEFRVVYGLPVSRIPLRRPCRRRTLAPRFFIDGEEKWDAITNEIVRTFHSEQPVLIGTRTVRDSENLAHRLDQCGLQYRLLNARQDGEEAAIIAEAGRRGQITIATNLAGRGADIPIGPDVDRLGGLLVIAVEPHESARIDRQLAGRCARQGEPGAYRLYASADDGLFTLFGHALARSMRMARRSGPEIERDFSNALRRLQERVDRIRFQQRLRLHRRDKWVEALVEKAG